MLETKVPALICSISPIVLATPSRVVDLQLRVTVPARGGMLPVLLLSHGHGQSNHLSSLNGYAPLAQHYAAHGFAVIQPTHLDSKTLRQLGLDDAGEPLHWKVRARDMHTVLDRLGEIEAHVAPLGARFDAARVAVLGHSMGGHTASLLLGARHTVADGSTIDLRDRRIRAGVLLAAPGSGATLSKFAAEHYAFFSTIDFSSMITPALVVAGDKDGSPHLTVAGPAWHADPYHLAPSPKSLLTLAGAEHGLGGVSGFDVAETTDESPERVALLQRVTTAYLQSALGIDANAFTVATNELAGSAAARIASK